MAGPWGEAIRRLREAKKLTKKKLAKDSRLSPTTYGLIERGGHTQTRNLEKIAIALSVSLPDVLVPPRQVLEREERRELAREITEDVLRALDVRSTASPTSLAASSEENSPSDRRRSAGAK